MKANLGTYRPSTLSEIKGQDMAKQYLMLKVKAALQTRTLPGHTLFLGPSGTGKTTFSEAFANDLNKPLRKVMCGEEIKTKADLIRILQEIRSEEILFLDEIHLIKSAWQDALYGAMEDRKITYSVNNIPRTIALPNFMIIGATTHVGKLNAALLTRFQHKIQFAAYNLREMMDIISSRAKGSYGIDLDQSVVYTLAQLSQGTPRVAGNLLKSLVDLSFAYGPRTVIDGSLLHTLLRFEGIDPMIGLDIAGRAYISAIAGEGGTNVGLGVIAAKTNMTEETVKDVVEPFLMGNVELTYYSSPTATTTTTEVGPLVKVGSKGRVLTKLGETYLTQIKSLQQYAGWFPGEIF